MKFRLMLSLAFIAFCASDKEELGDLTELLNDPQFSDKLLLALEKRLSSSPKGNENNPTGGCQFVTNTSTIIKTHDSISNGAQFITAPPHLGKEACIRKCCENLNCSVAVVKEV